ncbi:hypothetical protein [Actinomadura kijaniata]|uniref:hypothetical protein n=1 Tax=Actinomadura kijaniata TaxID=46161 RepID=UPI000830AC12|nr:hypothetical protein [Actinomadura kijaniata]
MTDLFEVTIDGHEDRSLSGSLECLHDPAFVPQNVEFPLQLIMDAWRMMREGFSFAWAPFSAREGTAIAHDSPVRAGLQELHDLCHGRGVRAPATGRKPSPGRAAPVRDGGRS